MTKNFAKIKNDVWETPYTVFQDAVSFFGIHPKLDVCADQFNTKCDFYYTEADDGLKQIWWTDAWLNAPYSEASKWIYKAYEENQKNNINIIALLNVTTDTRAWHDCILNDKAEIYFIKGRLKFLKDGKMSKQASQHPSCYVCWRSREKNYE
tara:strand:- start:27 stop:482 length:456 start_codon:yes stop_codon:yes gene_type:complete